MSDSSKFSSLFALVDSHLSKTSLQENGGNTYDGRLSADVLTSELNLLSLNGLCNGSVSESLVSLYTQPKLPISSVSSIESPIQTILAQQVANLLKVTEKEKEEAKKKFEEELKCLKIEDEKNSVIDLMKAIQTTYHPQTVANKDKPLSRSSSVESLLKLRIQEEITETEIINIPEPILPCIQDMSFILKEKLKIGKCSSFGKVLLKRWRPLPSPYFKVEIPSSIPRFDFSTPSPCDIVTASLRKPTMSSTFTLDVTKFV